MKLPIAESLLRQGNSTTTSSTAQNIVDALSFINDVVTFVWIGLTILMVASIFVLYRPVLDRKNTRRNITIGAVILLIIATWTYPLYSGGFNNDNLIRPLYSNYGYAAFYAIVFVIVISYSAWAALLLFPTFVWLVLATTYTIAQIKARN